MNSMSNPTSFNAMGYSQSIGVNMHRNPDGSVLVSALPVPVTIAPETAEHLAKWLKEPSAVVDAALPQVEGTIAGALDAAYRRGVAAGITRLSKIVRDDVSDHILTEHENRAYFQATGETVKHSTPQDA